MKTIVKRTGRTCSYFSTDIISWNQEQEKDYLKRVPIKTYILNKSNHNLDKQTPKQKGRTFSKSPVHADFETVLNLIHSYNISRYIYEKVWGWKKLTFKFSMNLTLFGNDERVDVPCLFIKYCSIFEFLLRENCYDVKIK